MKLCINPSCHSHCEVKYDDTFHEWRFAGGFQSSLSKTQMKYFDPKDEYNLCEQCEGMMVFLTKLNLLPKVQDESDNL